jgi:hypothetical protein
MAYFSGQTPSGQQVAELEVLIRTAIFKPATCLVECLLQQAADRIDAGYQAKAGEHFKGRATLQLQCLFGTFTILRDYYYHSGKKLGHFPADAGLGLEVGYTPALARLMCLEGADEPGFEKAERHLKESAGIEVSARQIQRVVGRVGADAQVWQGAESSPEVTDAPVLYVSADGTGVPARQEALAGRKGKQADGSAKTRQVYLGCVFTQHKTDEKGHPMRDWNSTSYVCGIMPIHEFGPLLRREAIRRGMGSAGKVVLLIDGAVSLECMGKDCFKDATQIVDFFHAMEHAAVVLELLIGKDHPEYRRRLRQWAKRLLKNGVKKLIEESRRESMDTARQAAVEDALGYFVRNEGRMQYGTYRKNGFFIGSGVVEAGCKSVIGYRCKQSGMRWSMEGAQNILALRCIHSSRRSDAFWNSRLNRHSARNDSLALSA